MKHVALFFGSFNPVHYGHLAVAEYVVSHKIADAVWMVVSPQNPLKPSNILASEQDRLRMVELALENNPHISVCDLEFFLPRPSYTINTLNELRLRYPELQFSILVGEDLLNTFHLWKSYIAILEQHPIIVYPRPGASVASPEIDWEGFRVHRTDAPVFGISSTLIRKNVASNLSNRYLTTDKVIDYMKDHSLYVSPE